MDEKQLEILKASLNAEHDKIMEKWRQDWESNLERWKHTRNWEIQSLQGVIQFAVITIRSLILVNGGAVVVLLALIGSIWGTDPDSGTNMSNDLRDAFSYFILGLLASVLTGGLAYLAQVFATEAPDGKNWQRNTGIWCRIIAVILAIGGLTFFGLGAFASLDAFGG